MSEERDGIDSMFARDEQGRFASREPTEPEAVEVQDAPAQQPAEAQPDPQAEPAAPVEAKPEPPQTVPLATFKELERQVRDLKRGQAPQEATRTQAPPSFYDDPDAYQAHLDQRLADTELKVRMDMSQRFALQQHGAEALEAARQWGYEQAQADPTFSQRFGGQPDPVGWLVSQHKQAETLNRLGGKSLDDFIREQVEQRMAEQAAAQPQAAPAQGQAPAVPPQRAPAAPPPPKSLTRQPSAGGIEEVPDIGIGTMFGR